MEILLKPETEIGADTTGDASIVITTVAQLLAANHQE
jgi:hypothetical protein